MTKAEKLLRELIALPSVNPAYLPARDPRAGEQRVADFLASDAFVQAYNSPEGLELGSDTTLTDIDLQLHQLRISRFLLLPAQHP